MAGQIVFVGAVGVWAVLEVALHLFYNRRVRQRNAERLSKYVMLAVFALAGLGARIVTPDFAAGFREPFTPLRWAGVLVILAAQALRILAVAHLGGWYSVNLGVQPGQRLVTSGVYARLRHPGYLALLASFAGLGLCYWHWLATPLCVVLPTAVVAWRVVLEERTLAAAYGEEYRTWARRTRRFIPGIL